MIRITYDPSAPVTAVNLPGSKSVAARAYVLNAIFNGWFMLTNIPDCDDTSDLGFALFKGEEEYDNPDAVYNLGSGATSLRFFLAYMASQPLFNGIIDCSPSLRRRPLAPLVDALRQAGADIEYLEEEGRPPLRVRGRALNGDGVKLAPGVSSQFESAMMMASLIWDSPYVPQSAPGVSRPYVEMTARMIEEMRRMVDENDNGFTMLYKIETDWSAASYFYELALIRPGRRFTLPGLRPPGESLQGDSACVDIFGRLGVDSEFDGEGNLVICGAGRGRRPALWISATRPTLCRRWRLVSAWPESDSASRAWPIFVSRSATVPPRLWPSSPRPDSCLRPETRRLHGADFDARLSPNRPMLRMTTTEW